MNQVFHQYFQLPKSCHIKFLTSYPQDASRRISIKIVISILKCVLEIYKILRFAFRFHRVANVGLVVSYRFCWDLQVSLNYLLRFGCENH